MIERQYWRRSATRGFVLLLGLGAVGGAGYWSGKDTFSYANEQLGKDWEQFLREYTITDDTYIGMMARIGRDATKCFGDAGGVGLSRVVPVNGDTKPAVLFRLQGNESIDPKAIEACIYEQSGDAVIVSQVTKKAHTSTPPIEAIKDEFEKYFSNDENNG